MPEPPAEASRQTRAGRARYRRILRFALRALVVEWWFELFLPRLGLGAVGRRSRIDRWQRIARRFHALAVDLGGLMIKVGQFLSTRMDILPPEITRELEGLQDEVPPVPFADIRALAGAELGMPLERAYARVEEVPIASASLGQVHRALLAPAIANEVGFVAAVVKVQRPGIEAIVDIDLAALRRVARWLSRVRLVNQRADMPALVDEFATTSREELDYLHEAAGAERFALDTQHDARVQTPAVVWERVTRRVLTLSDVTAIKVTDVAGLAAAGIDPGEVAHELARTMFDQLFVHGYFHGDPHPGNIFVEPAATGASGAADWRLTFVDFGMMGEISDALRTGLRRIVIAIAARDGRGLIAGITEVGFLLPGADTAHLERTMGELFERFGGMGVGELQQVDPRELRAFAERFRDTIRSMPFQLPEDFLLVIRAVEIVSGVCSTLDPDFNMWNAVEPYADSLVRNESAGFVREIAEGASRWGTSMARLPGRLDGMIDELERGRLAVRTPDADRRLRALDRTLRRTVSAVLFAGLVIAGVLLLPVVPALGWTLMGVSVIPFAHAALAGFTGTGVG